MGRSPAVPLSTVASSWAGDENDVAFAWFPPEPTQMGFAVPPGLLAIFLIALPASCMLPVVAAASVSVRTFVFSTMLHAF